MNRTAERVLGIISLVFTVIGVAATIFGAVLFNLMSSSPDLRSEIEMDLYSDPSITQADMDMIFSFFDAIGGFMWLGVVFLVISLILTDRKSVV